MAKLIHIKYRGIKMNQRNSDKTTLSMDKTSDKDNFVRSEESLIRAVSVLKSLSDWNKGKWKEVVSCKL